MTESKEDRADRWLMWACLIAAVACMLIVFLVPEVTP